MLAEGFTQYLTIQTECNGCEHALHNVVTMVVIWLYETRL